MSDAGLTKRQREILDFIRRESQRKGYPPSIREIGEAFNLSSPSTVHGHLSRLARKGYIRRDPQKRRAIELLRPPRDQRDAGDEEASYPAEGQPRRQPLWVPLVGRVTAGQPILAVENIEDWLPLGGELDLQGELFALRVQGDSMKDAGILHGDIVIVRRQENADNGSIVVALIDEEATVKRFFREESVIRLQPANDAYPEIVTTQATILGKVVALLRRFVP